MTVWIFAIIGFFIAVQLACCLAFKRKRLKLLPIYLLAAMWLYCLIEYLGAGFDKGPFSGLWALVFAIFCGIASASVALAWLVFALVTFLKKQKSKA